MHDAAIPKRSTTCSCFPRPEKIQKERTELWSLLVPLSSKYLHNMDRNHVYQRPTKK